MNSKALNGTNIADVERTAAQRGLVCPKCGCRHLYVVYTRARAGCILRLRECRHCGRRIPTRERA